MESLAERLSLAAELQQTCGAWQRYYPWLQSYKWRAWQKPVPGYSIRLGELCRYMQTVPGREVRLGEFGRIWSKTWRAWQMYYFRHGRLAERLFQVGGQNQGFLTKRLFQAKKYVRLGELGRFNIKTGQGVRLDRQTFSCCGEKMRRAWQIVCSRLGGLDKT